MGISIPSYLRPSPPIIIGLVLFIIDISVSGVLYFSLWQDSIYDLDDLFYLKSIISTLLLFVVLYMVTRIFFSPFKIVEFFTEPASRYQFVIRLLALNCFLSFLIPLFNFEESFITLFLGFNSLGPLRILSYNIIEDSHYLHHFLVFFLFRGVYLTFIQITFFGLVMYVALKRSNYDYWYLLPEENESDDLNRDIFVLSGNLTWLLVKILILMIIGYFFLLIFRAVFPFVFLVTLFGPTFIFPIFLILLQLLWFELFVQHTRGDKDNKFAKVSRIGYWKVCVLMYILSLLFLLIFTPNWFIYDVFYNRFTQQRYEVIYILIQLLFVILSMIGGAFLVGEVFKENQAKTSK